jgi:hypothetical protein
VSGAPISVADVVLGTFAAFGRTLSAVIPVAVAVSVPVAALDGGFAARVLGGGVAGQVVAWIAWTALILLELAVVTSYALRRLRREPASVVTALAEGVARLPAVAATCALSTVAIGFGLVVFLGPGLVALSSLSVALPAAVDGRGDAWASINRSVELTHGVRVRVLAAAALLLAAWVLANVAFAVAFSYVAQPLTAAAIARDLLVAIDVVKLAAFSGVHVLVALPAVGAAVVYEALREAKESPRPAELERVFE